ncbi:MAG: type I DNA topoisomerase, partial [bacterium]|nr:type I DNA topoisomerase [bacterium]
MPEKTLIIVESPNKIKTIKQFLGQGYNVEASVGHIRDLPERKLGVDVKNGFDPEYIMVRGKNKVINSLKKAVKQAAHVYLAPDPDREGEAISWHLAEILGINPQDSCRITFNAITREAVLKALDNPHPIDMDLVYAQQSRRILDRLVGYRLSPILWKKIRRGLSAGRVQSVALLLVCQRETERLAFTSEEYWTITALLRTDNKPPESFSVKLVKIDGEKCEIHDEKAAKELEERLEAATFTIQNFVIKASNRQAPLPFVTSTLQQDAFRRFGFPVKKTMSLAQRLYEGRAIGDRGVMGLVTYIRTDSYRVEKQAFNMARRYIIDQYGEEYALRYPRKIKSKKKKKGRVEDAHEAIRPTDLTITSEEASGYLKPDELKLYSLIYARFVASQMQAAKLENQEVTVIADDLMLKAQGSRLLFPGFLASMPRTRYSEFGVKPSLPTLEKGMILNLDSVNTEQFFTQPPPRYSEGSLVKELERLGIGRPSTYASIISTLKSRKYALSEKKRIKPTDMGMVVNDRMKRHFPEIINIDFTASMEEDLDNIEDGSKHWVEILSGFYDVFSKKVKSAEKNMEKVRIKTDIECSSCGSPLMLQFGRNGEFLACSGYPKCKRTMNLPAGFSFLEYMSMKDLDNGSISIFIKDKVDLENPEQLVEPDPETGKPVVCPKCAGTMISRNGRFGPFLSCSNYPKCKGTQKIIQYVEGVCPDCSGRLTVKYSKRGRRFFGCEKYPDCKYATYRKPSLEKK